MPTQEEKAKAQRVNEAYEKLTKKKYTLKPGLNWGDRKQYGHNEKLNPLGPVVELNARQVKGIEHMFEPQKKKL